MSRPTTFGAPNNHAKCLREAGRLRLSARCVNFAGSDDRPGVAAAQPLLRAQEPAGCTNSSAGSLEAWPSKTTKPNETGSSSSRPSE